MAQPRLPDNQTISQMIRDQLSACTPFKDSMKQLLRINDEQIAINRYKWYNLPAGLDGQLIERILYYRGMGMFFYIEEEDKFHFLPCTLDGSKGTALDYYGRWKSVRPLPFMGTTENSESKRSKTPQEILLSTQTREVLYDFPSDDLWEDLTTKCVLLTDYCRQLSQTILPRQKVNEGIIDIESNIIPYVNTLLSNSTGVSGMRVNDASEESSVQQASDTAQLAALNGKKWIGITAPMDLQDFSTTTSGAASDMLMAMQSIDNIRLGTFGLDNGGIFEKKSHLLNAEAAMNTGTSSLIMDDGLYQRQTFCNIVNMLAPLGVWCEINETAAGADMNLDGVVGANDPEASNTMAEQTGGGTDGDQE